MPVIYRPALAFIPFSTVSQYPLGWTAWISNLLLSRSSHQRLVHPSPGLPHRLRWGKVSSLGRCRYREVFSTPPLAIGLGVVPDFKLESYLFFFCLGHIVRKHFNHLTRDGHFPFTFPGRSCFQMGGSSLYRQSVRHSPSSTFPQCRSGKRMFLIWSQLS